MQVLDEKLPRFRERVLDEFKSSENYASLKKDRTRDASLAVLTYLANQGGGLVRRNKLKAVFVVGGADKSERLRDRETGDKSITSLRDNELQ